MVRWSLFLGLSKSGLFVFLRDGDQLEAKRLIVTVGTFFDGTLHQGEKISPGGRIGCEKSVPASSIGLNVKLLSKKFKTGTPPRILRSSVSLYEMEPQESDSSAQNFGFLNDPFSRSLPQVPCYKTHTNQRTIQKVLENKEKKPNV